MSDELTPEQRIKELEARLESTNQSLLTVMGQKRDLEVKLASTEAKLTVAEHKVRTLIGGLSYYKPGPFWDTVLVNTKADEDRGTHAAWILRLTDPDNPEAA